MIDDLVVILLLIVALMFMVDYSRRPPKGRDRTMDDDG